MTELRRAAEMALKFCEDIGDLGGPYPYVNETAIVSDSRKVLQALRQALAQPVDAVNMSQERVDETSKREHEPVAWMWKDGSLTSDPYEADGTWTKLYTTPPKREWVGLTDEEVHILWMDMGARPKINGYDFAKVIESKLKERNCG